MECKTAFQTKKMDRRPLTLGSAYFLIMLCMHAVVMPTYGQSLPRVQFTSLDWPPYTAQQLAHQGATSAVVSAAMASMGYRVEVSFYPWNRAVALARSRSSYIGYFPEYQSKEASVDFLFSDPIGSGPLGLAEHADTPVHWERLDDLAHFQIGVVAGYINTEQFDDRVRRGLQRVDYASSDKQNLLKLAAKRVQLVVIDQRVFDYLIRHDPQVVAVARKLRFNVRLLESKQLHVCFRRTPEGERMRKIFNEGLRRINVDVTMELALKEILDAP
ncbi:transporter substrate-binding domain-containing protein [Massilia sp. SR12]